MDRTALGEVGALLLGVVIAAACSQPVDEAEASLTPGAAEACRLVLEKVDVGEEAVVVVWGPVAPGTTLREPAWEPHPDAEPDEMTAPAELRIPDEDGEYYLFVIDDHPTLKPGHPLRFAWIAPGTDGGFATVDARFFPLIERPDVPDPTTPLRARGHAVIAGAHVLQVEGDGAPRRTDGTPKSPRQPPTGGDLPTPTADGFLEAALEGGSCVRRSMVVDFGNPVPPVSWALESGWGWLNALVQSDWAPQDDGIRQWLRGYGYEPLQFSQSPDDPHAATTAAGFMGWLDAHREFFARTPADDCCHEFFLYISAHGSEQGALAHAAPDGSYAWSTLFYADIYKRLGEFPKSVKITVFVDACYSGMAIPETVPADHPQRRAADRVQQALAYLEDGRCGVTILASTAFDEPAPAPTAVTDSATEDFLEDAEDADGDGVVGDIRDRFASMEEQGILGMVPVVYVRPKGAQHWCSTDVAPGARAQPNPWCGDGKVNGVEACDRSSGSDAPCHPDEYCRADCRCDLEATTADCQDRECGPDGAGGSCGACDDGETCAEGRCVCVPDCAGKPCGDDGCGAWCGDCPAGERCVDGACSAEAACGDGIAQPGETCDPTRFGACLLLPATCTNDVAVADCPPEDQGWHRLFFGGATCDALPGACCMLDLEDSCVDVATEADCPSRYIPDRPCEAVSCTWGACCDAASETCTGPELGCWTVGGVLVEHASCSDFTCTVGVCCESDGSCRRNRAGFYCLDEGDVFHAGATTCAEAGCPQPP